MAEKAKGWLWYALAGTVALVAFFYFRSEPVPPAEPGPVYDAATEQRARWAEFCARFPCEELPIGFATYDTFGKRFYVPLPATIVAKTGRSAEGLVRAVRGVYSEVSPTAVGSPQTSDYLRSYGASESNLFIGGCCEALLAYYGLAGPGYTDGMSSSFLNWPNIRLINGNNESASGRIYLSSYVHRDSDTPDPRMTPESLPEGYLTPFSTDFNYLNSYRSEGFTILSKQPMVDDRYIIGTCDVESKCAYNALRNPTDPVMNPNNPEGNFPLYAAGVFFYEHIPRECRLALAGGSVNCPEVDVEFSKMAQFIRLTARMLELMQEPPVQLQGTP